MNSGVRKFFESVDSSEIDLAVQTIGELRRNVENLKHRGDVVQHHLLIICNYAIESTLQVNKSR